MRLPTFDQLMALLDTNPAEFESLRKRLIEEEMRNAMPQHLRRLRGLQFQIDGLSRTSKKNPLDCCVRLQRELDGKLDELSAVLHDHHRPEPQVRPPKNIIRLPGKGEADEK